MKRILLIPSILFVIASCGEELMVPKPPTYLRMDLPDHKYKGFRTDCGPGFDLSEAFTSKTTAKTETGICNLEVDLGPLNGTLYLFYYPLSKSDTLSKFINFSNDKVDDHKLKATAINDEKILRPKDRVFGTFFELHGDVATNYQFYLTDSTNHFLRGEVLLNSRPNYDSLKPSLDYLKVDLKRIVSSLKWN